MCRTPVFTVALVIIAAVAAPHSHAAVSLFMYIEGLTDGSPTDETHQDWIILESISIPVQTDQPPTLSGLGPIIGEFVITKQQDIYSVALAQAAADATIYTEIKIEIVFPPPPNPNIMFMGEWNAEVVQFLDLGPAPQPLTFESFAINYGKIEYKYTEIDPSGAKSEQKAVWDDVEQPPTTSTEGTPGQFKLLNMVTIPEPSSALILTPAWLLLATRRRRA